LSSDVDGGASSACVDIAMRSVASMNDSRVGRVTKITTIMRAATRSQVVISITLTTDFNPIKELLLQ
jgi:hypothetical protein